MVNCRHAKTAKIILSYKMYRYFLTEMMLSIIKYCIGTVYILYSNDTIRSYSCKHQCIRLSLFI